jgi:hypothetical protein
MGILIRRLIQPVTSEMRPRCLKLSFRLLKRAGNTMGTNAEAVIRRASTWTNATVISKL